MTNQFEVRDPTTAGRQEHIDTVVIGAGQAGLALGYHLARKRQQFVILDENARVGDGWRRRYESLRLYSPAKYDALPGGRFPLDRYEFPTGLQLADYLEGYAAEHRLPVRSRVYVDGLRQDGTGYVVSTNEGEVAADQVVVATGGQHLPHTPEFAAELDPGIRQLHSSEYRNPSQLLPCDVLVVGASHSGADLALEIARSGHRTTLSGPVHGELPFQLEGKPARQVLKVLWFLANHVLTVRTPMGRKMQTGVRSEGGPLLRVKTVDLDEAGVDRTEGKVVGVRDGLPVLADGRVLDVENVIWCTGFRRDFGWIDGPVLGEDGWPAQYRGVSSTMPGLYFLGLLFQYAFASMLTGGAGRDAAYVAHHIATRTKTELKV
ncbi:putative flavoprotein involved in K+ transport [Kribbella amoyensis]|uniref:Putative flavoprotein involved in K+ transport n=1 Tax=Kribbella amoyensis TaxID=996641 RepID=A0A561BZR6_9ACTN|nr:NAD(P)-binding domain-containing protein [Kribbella amoyensis]TWD84318.1 putative flavoprotein involved in K+ transport [Kribbella amoyensis]